MKYATYNEVDEDGNLIAFSADGSERFTLPPGHPDVIRLRDAVDQWKGTPNGQAFDVDEFLTDQFDQGDPERWAGTDEFVFVDGGTLNHDS